jgi:Holliday junction resolvase RusA-like endonuclease
VSVNAAGSAPYRSWRQKVYDESVLTHQPGGAAKIVTGCTVWVRYFRRLDRVKDVDNILKAILDALNGRGSVSRRIDPSRILIDDRVVEHVVSSRTDLRFHTAIKGSQLSSAEFGALIRAQYAEAAVAVIVGAPPSHQGSIL